MLELRHIHKDYIIDNKPFNALKDVNISFRKKEFCCILGPSGCGKTTLLNIIGGLDQYTSGNLYINGVSTNVFKAKDWDNYRNKKIGFVFQNYNLVPHLSILENVELSLVLDGVGRKERKEKAIECLKKVGLDGIINKKPNQLSGGQMQRVAIARALINDPEIILADEPTGALDSVTSVQVMDLIKELSNERLVIMVTHNEELANKYATRIIKMKDGEILSDSNKAKPNFLPIKTKKVEKKKTSMSFLTALKMSLKNLLTKKGRTILTSVAASIGIIGVALVLSLSNGFQNYVGRVQSETASQTPVNLPSYTTVKSENESEDYNQNIKFPDTTDIFPYIAPTSTVIYKYNSFSEKYFNFLNYLKNDKKLINDYITNYVDSYSYNLVTEFPKSFNGEYDQSIDFVDYVSNYPVYNTLSSLTGLPTNLFHVLYGEEEYITESYDLIEGNYPEKNNELVLVVDNCNRIDFSILQKLGFYNTKDEQTSVIDGTTSKIKSLSWEDDIKDKTYKVFNNNQLYENVGELNLVDGDNNERNLKEYKQNDITNLFSDDAKGKTLKVVGILRPKKTTTIPLMTTGLCYLKSLQETLVEENTKASLVEDFKKNIVLKNVNGFGTSNFASMIFELSQLSANDTLTTTSVANLLNKYFSFRGVKNIGEEYSGVASYLKAAKGFGCDMVSKELLEKGLTDKDFLTEYFTNMINLYNEGKVIEATNLLIGFYGYLDSYSVIRNVVIFPTNLTTKSQLLEELDEYNKISEDPNDIYHASNKNEQINYVDISSSLTGGIGQMITVISIVLVIFASISLLVSCVMTGIITYTSVLERTKEIGILRAVGARKKDVGRLFQAESAIVGGFSGFIGCLAAYLITIPINIILNNVYSDYNLGQIADLNIYAAVILVIISILLTLVSGLIPSRIASKKDPVIALRTE